MTPKPNPSDPGPLAKRKLNTRTTSSANMSQTERPSQASPMKARMELAAKMKDEDKLYKRDGILYSTILSPPETMDKLKDLEVRDDDVVLVAYPKCGFNWVLAVLRKIMNASTGKNEAPPEGPPLVEFLPPDVQQKLSEMPPRRLLGTHLHPDHMPASFFSKNPKILVVFRNPKDTLVSYFHFMNKNPVLPSAEPWDKFYSDFMSGEVPWGFYFDHALAWEKRFDDPKVMIVTYEELKQNLPEEVKKISEFFGFPLTEEQVNSIAEQSTFRAMLETSKQSHGNLGSVFFRKGEVGDWKNLFSEDQSKQMDKLFHSKMDGTKLGAQMKYDLYCK